MLVKSRAKQKIQKREVNKRKHLSTRKTGKKQQQSNFSSSRLKLLNCQSSTSRGGGLHCCHQHEEEEVIYHAEWSMHPKTQQCVTKRHYTIDWSSWTCNTLTYTIIFQHLFSSSSILSGSNPTNSNKLKRLILILYVIYLLFKKFCDLFC